MNLEKVSLERTFNIGNYESIRVGLECSVNTGENPLDVLRQLEDTAETYLTTARFKNEKAVDKPANETVTPAPEPKGVIVDLAKIEWTHGGTTDKGTYEISTSKPIDYFSVKKAIEEKGKPVYMDGYIVWYMDKEDVLARRRK